MIIVIIAGGSGSRLWPLSTPDYPKQLICINGDKRSLLQHTYDRAKKLTDKIYIVSESSHIKHVKTQLSELPDSAFIIEPGRRGTANCLIAAFEYIGRKHDQDEVIASIHADHFIRDDQGFTHSFKTASETSTKENRIVLVGVEPDYPATGFGYIKKGSLLSEEPYVYNVDSFKEKPDYRTAREYYRSGKYLWNCGYFVGSLNTFLIAVKANAPKLYGNFQALQKAGNKRDSVYLGFDSEAIDTALIEKVPNLLVIPASFDWMDLGSFGDLHKAIGSDEQGNYMVGNIEALEVENSFIHNNEDKPIAVIGLDNVVVVNTKNGILVARKDLAQEVGEVSKKLYK